VYLEGSASDEGSASASELRDDATLEHGSVLHLVLCTPPDMFGFALCQKDLILLGNANPVDIMSEVHVDPNIALEEKGCSIALPRNCPHDPTPSCFRDMPVGYSNTFPPEEVTSAWEMAEGLHGIEYRLRCDVVRGLRVGICGAGEPKWSIMMNMVTGGLRCIGFGSANDCDDLCAAGAFVTGDYCCVVLDLRGQQRRVRFFKYAAGGRDAGLLGAEHGPGFLAGPGPCRVAAMMSSRHRGGVSVAAVDVHDLPATSMSHDGGAKFAAR
jgi:hypothetical protein